MNSEDEKIQNLRRELLVLNADYDDLLKRLDKWSKRFFKLYKQVNEKNEKENDNE